LFWEGRKIILSPQRAQRSQRNYPKKTNKIININKARHKMLARISRICSIVVQRGGAAPKDIHHRGPRDHREISKKTNKNRNMHKNRNKMLAKISRLCNRVVQRAAWRRLFIPQNSKPEACNL
jgi:hypothetical protein